MAFKTHKGYYVPLNPKKYYGDITNIRFLSNWERIFMVQIDQNPRVLKWNSEDVHIPYICGTDGRPHKYMVDICLEYKGRDGDITRQLIEIKPYAQTIPPMAPKRNTAKSRAQYLHAQITWVKNQAKWEAASVYCKNHGMLFRFCTEYELGLKKRKPK